MNYVLGVDVGSRSARVGLFSLDGVLIESASQEIAIYNPLADHAEHASAEIWDAIAHSCRNVMRSAAIAPENVVGIGFDATCSLVATDQQGMPVSLSTSGQSAHDTIVWMDHRALKEADEINATGHKVLDNVGGTISLEMQTPKLKWLKANLPDQFSRAAYFFDLPDWLTFRATGSKTRSLCSATCKWTYQTNPHNDQTGWDKTYFDEIGLADLLDRNAEKIGNQFVSPGHAIGSGLSAQAAGEFGLQEGTPVGASLIDAYSGALGTFGAGESEGKRRMALIAGTSACHIMEADGQSFVPGVWGPYGSVMREGLWALEAGQSAAGALIDRVINGHAAVAKLQARAKQNNGSIHAEIEAELNALAQDQDLHLLTEQVHVGPDFHGNRSPIADPTRRGQISGLDMQHGVSDLAILVLATIQSLAYGTRHIVEEMQAKNVQIDELVVSGGLAKNEIYLQAHADALQMPVVVPAQEEPVLLGSAMLGAVAGGRFLDLNEGMAQMGGQARKLLPRSGKIAAFHDAKYEVFRRMQADFAAYRTIMSNREDR